MLHRVAAGRLTGAVGTARVAAPVLALAAVLVVLGLDAVQFSRWWPVMVTGALDEPAHLLTAGLLLAAVAPARGRLVPWALAGSVLIDLDHVPLYARWGAVAADGGRPVSHSLVTVAALGLVAALVRPWRMPAAGLAVGVVLHFTRDLATGPGVPLLAPWADAGVRVPYAWYAALLVLAAAVSAARWWRRPGLSGRR